MRGGFFVIVAIILSKLREAYERIYQLLRIDGLTGIMNGQEFYRVADQWISDDVRGQEHHQECGETRGINRKTCRKS